MNNTIKEIADNWKLEARQEDNNKYFFHTKESEKILAGDKFYVIGRKGAGKTAISEFILGKKGYNIFSEKLSFKNFPFNELYELDDRKYTSPNQYISIWKYIIYSTICKLMAQNQKIEKEIKKILEELYPPSNKPLRKLLNGWISKEFGFSILGNTINIKLEKDLGKFNQSTWVQKIDILEDIIDEYIDDSKYYIIFDELDEDYRSFATIEEKSNYDFLITSLFKAVQDVKNSFKDKKNSVNIITFLMDEKNKCTLKFKNGKLLTSHYNIYSVNDAPLIRKQEINVEKECQILLKKDSPKIEFSAIEVNALTEGEGFIQFQLGMDMEHNCCEWFDVVLEKEFEKVYVVGKKEWF